MTAKGKKIVPVRKHVPYIHYPPSHMLFNEGDQTDENGNWIKKITRSPGRFIIRTLVYEGEEKTLLHPLVNIENIPKEIEREINYGAYRLEDGEAKWIAKIFSYSFTIFLTTFSPPAVTSSM